MPVHTHPNDKNSSIDLFYRALMTVEVRQVYQIQWDMSHKDTLLTPVDECHRQSNQSSLSRLQPDK